MLAIAGLVYTWRECKLLLTAIALATFVSLMAARIFLSGGYGDRIGLDFGTIGNPNDYAGHLILVLPFLLWILLTKRSIAWRLSAFAGIGYGLYVIVGSASRGAMIALIVAFVFIILRATMRQRFAVLALAPIAAFSLIAFVSPQALQRIMSFSSSQEGALDEAIMSKDQRRYLLEQSIRYTITHPLFGIGPNQFSVYEGKSSRAVGLHGAWLSTHNSYTQVSSECGIPAFIFYLLGIFSSFRLLSRTWRQSRKHPAYQDITTMMFCLMLAFIGYFTAILFLNFAYLFYTPAMVAVAVVVTNGAQQELRSRTLPPKPAAPAQQFPKPVLAR
jgi:O-antigen ligase